MDTGTSRKRWSLAESVEQVVTQYKLCQSLLELSRLPCWAGPDTVDHLLWNPKPARSASSATMTHHPWKSEDHLNAQQQTPTNTDADDNIPSSSPERLHDGVQRRRQSPSPSRSGHRQHSPASFVEPRRDLAPKVSNKVNLLPSKISLSPCQLLPNKVLPPLSKPVQADPGPSRGDEQVDVPMLDLSQQPESNDRNSTNR